MSPIYEVGGNLYGWNPEPPESHRDVCIVEAYTKREAKIRAYRHFSTLRDNYFRDCCVGLHPPYKHIELEELTGAVQENPEVWWGEDYIRMES